MKYWRKIAGILLGAMICLLLSGCGAFQAQMAKTTTRMSQLETLHVDVEAYAKAAFDIGRQTIHESATVTGGFDASTDPLLLKTDLQVDAFGVVQDLKLYIQKEYDTWSFFPWEDDRLINKGTVKERDAKRSRAVQALKLLIKCGDFFSEAVDDTVNDAHARRYDGVLPLDYVNEALVLLNIKEADEDASPAGTASAPRPSAPTVEGLLEEMKKAAPAQEGEAAQAEAAREAATIPVDTDGIPASIWINDEDMIVQVDAAIGDFLQDLGEERLQKLLTDYDLDGLVLDMDLEYVDVRLTFSQFDGVEGLKLPDY